MVIRSVVVGSAGLGTSGDGTVRIGRPRRPGSGEQDGVEAGDLQGSDLVGGGDARTAVHADGRIVGQVGEPGPQLGGRPEPAVRPEIVGGGTVERAGNMTRPRVNRLGLAAVTLTGARVDSPRLILRTRAAGNVSVGAHRHRLVASIQFEDNGPGVLNEIREIIFYPLVSGRADGSGLGLGIAQDLVSRHGGLIEFDSAPGRTIFVISLPMDSA